jgi:hypothetical protein
MPIGAYNSGIDIFDIVSATGGNPGTGGGGPGTFTLPTGTGLVTYSTVTSAFTSTGVDISEITTTSGIEYALNDSADVSIHSALRGAFLITVNPVTAPIAPDTLPHTSFAIAKGDKDVSVFEVTVLAASDGLVGAVPIAFQVKWDSDTGIELKLSANGADGNYEVGIVGH